MKYDMDNGMWWGLINDSILYRIMSSRTPPTIFDFSAPFSTEHTYEIIPLKILPETY